MTAETGQQLKKKKLKKILDSFLPIGVGYLTTAAQ